MTSCGGNCACASASTSNNVCAVPASPIVLDEGGKCPCGKTADACCHAESKVGQNEALGELCAPHNGKNVCS